MTIKNDRNFFEAMYQKQKDPWCFASNPYELSRYTRIYDLLNHKKYRQIFEAGCSIGVLTEKLALLAHRVIAIDISPTAVSFAQKRCAHLNNVFISCNSLPQYNVDKATDLLILSEIGYYFYAEELKEIITNLLNNSLPTTTLLASHWLGDSKDHTMHANEVHMVMALFLNPPQSLLSQNLGGSMTLWHPK